MDILSQSHQHSVQYSDELKQCHSSDHKVAAEFIFHRQIKPVAGDYQTLRMLHDQAIPAQPIVWYVTTLSEKPISGWSIFENLKGPQRQHWINGLKHQYDKKNANMMVLSQPIPRDKPPEDSAVFNSVIACRIKANGKDLFKFET